MTPLHISYIVRTKSNLNYVPGPTYGPFTEDEAVEFVTLWGQHFDCEIERAVYAPVDDNARLLATVLGL